MIELAAFLGNPGTRYERTRHNVARRLGERLVERHAGRFAGKFNGRFALIRLQGGAAGAGAGHGDAPASNGGAAGKLLVLLPDTFMNRSGESVGACARYHGIERRDVLVAHDDVELPFGRVVLRRGGGLAGHNGLRSVAQHLSGNDFARLRIGIGRPRHGALSAHVLGAFTPEEEAALEDIERGVEEALGRLNEV